MEYRATQRHFIAVATVIVLSVLQSATAQLAYVTNTGAITITGYSGSGPAVTIPATLNGYPVTTIGSTAFEGDTSMTGLTIPNSVTNIGAYAFAASGLTGVTIPNSVIGIGQNAFAACVGLTNISVNAGNPVFSSLNGVLFDKAQDTLIQYPDAFTNYNYTVPASVTSISVDAFYGASSIASVTIPPSVTTIGSEAFAYCVALNTVYFAGNAPNAGSYAFYQTGSGKGVTVNYLPGTTGWQAFSAGQSIAGSMFWFLPAPEILNFEPTFGLYNNEFGFAISWATNAAVVVDACTNLVNPIWRPISTNTVTATIGTTNFTDPQWGSFRSRFYRLRFGLVSTPLTYVVNNGAITITGYTASNSLVTIPAAINGYPVVAIGNGAFQNNTSVTGVTIPAGVTSIGASAFAGSGLTTVSIPNSVTEIDQDAFASCASLTSITIPNSVTNISDHAFFGSGLTAVSIPNSVIEIDQYAFASCASLTAVAIPNSVTNIDAYAFADSGLTTITIPNSVIGIGQNALASCTSLTNITVNAGNPAYSSLDGVLFDRAQDTLIQYPPALISDNYTVPASVTTISDDAFYFASGVGSVTMPHNVTSIGNDAFAYCVTLNAVYFGGDAPNVGTFAFYDTGFGNGITLNYRPGTAGWPAFAAALEAFGQSLAASTLWYRPTPEVLNLEPTFGVHNNQFGFTISWATNANVVVDACTNPINPVWLPISTNTLTATNGTAYFSDLQWRAYSRRFYRLHSP